MHQSDRQALRALLAAIYSSIPDPSSAGMEAMTAEILRETRLFSSNTSFEWNHRQAVLRLPPELLGMCFSYLPLWGRVAASHVSQAWRAAAVGTPALWADIQYLRGDICPSAWLLRLCISRARALPIRLDVGVQVRGVAEVLKDSAHLMDFINVLTDVNAYSLANPCPLLHTLRLQGCVIIMDTFLGNTVGKLAELHTQGLRIQRPSHALATLTTVSVTKTTTSTLRHLFAACPALQSLSIADLRPEGDPLPWRPPHTLTHLVIETHSGSLDIVPLLLACDAASSLQRVSLQPGPLVDDLVFPLMVQGAVILDVRIDVNESVTVLAELAGECHRTLSLPTLIRGYRAQRQVRTFPPVFEQDAVAFTQLRYIALPLVALATFVADAPALPILETLQVRVTERQITHPDEGRSAATWELLSPLAAIRPCHVVLDLPRLTQLAARDGEAIVAALGPIAGHLRVTVHGFAPGVVTVPQGLEVQFV